MRLARKHSSHLHSAVKSAAVLYSIHTLTPCQQVVKSNQAIKSKQPGKSKHVGVLAPSSLLREQGRGEILPKADLSRSVPMNRGGCSPLLHRRRGVRGEEAIPFLNSLEFRNLASISMSFFVKPGRTASFWVSTLLLGFWVYFGLRISKSGFALPRIQRERQ